MRRIMQKFDTLSKEEILTLLEEMREERRASVNEKARRTVRRKGEEKKRSTNTIERLLKSVLAIEDPAARLEKIKEIMRIAGMQDEPEGKL